MSVGDNEVTISAYSIFKTEAPYDWGDAKIAAKIAAKTAAEKKEFTDYLKKKYRGELPELQALVESITKRVILFTDGNLGLMKDLCGLYHCTSNGRHLCYHNLLNKAETVSAVDAKKEVDELFRGQTYLADRSDKLRKTISYRVTQTTLEYRLQQGCTIFFDGLGCHDTPFLCQLSSKISDIKNFYNPSPKGRLIVSTLTQLDAIPTYFKSLFGVISLEPATSTNTNKVSFNDTDLIVTINGKEYLFEETTKEHRKNKLKEAYKLFEFLYNNQHRRVKKDEIGKGLKFDDNEQRVFNAVSKAKKVIKCSPYSISNEKEYDDRGDRGGYLLVIKR